jgi:hypothetical protein
MANEANRPDDVRATETELDGTGNTTNTDQARDNAAIVSASPSTPESVDERLEVPLDREVPLEASTDQMSSDPADAIPVPPAMSPAEIDERAQAVEAVRGKVDPETGVAT